MSDTFAAGVLGGAGLIHLLGGGIDEFQAALPDLTYLLAGVGFLLILLIEGVIVLASPNPDGHRATTGLWSSSTRPATTRPRTRPCPTRSSC